MMHFWYYKKRKCRTPTGVSHLRLFFYNKGSNWSGVALFGAKPPTQKLSAIPCCKHSIKQVETHTGFRVTNQTESQ